MSETQQHACFVIMPFTVREDDLQRYGNDPEHWREVYQGLIVPAVKDAGLSPQRDDDDYSTRLVGEGIWSKIEAADLVLCDMSSHNPNVHLELGWALRSDKKIVLIKDDQTAFNFDLNQFYTYEYSSRLQPTVLRVAVRDLSKVIRATLMDDVANYSMVSKLSLRERAAEAVSKGSVEMEMLSELLDEVRLLQRPLRSGVESVKAPRRYLGIMDPSQLPEKIVGSTWRKVNGLEEVLFISERTFVYTSVGTQRWIENDVTFDETRGTMELLWRHDGYRARCRFDSRFSEFVESNSERWILIATEPYVHPSLLDSSSSDLANQEAS